MTEQPIAVRRDRYLFAGAALVLATGIISIVNGIQGLLNVSNVLPYLSNSEATILPICGVLLLVFGAVSIASGIYGIASSHPRLAPVLLGAVLGILGGGYYGFFLGFAALALFWYANVDI
jgi:hypothetical protein